jgi:large subunit ribosomal protein L6
MSRIGKKPISVESGISTSLADHRLTIKGPKGELSLIIPSSVNVECSEGVIQVSVANPTEKQERSLWGLYRMLIGNMVTGVKSGFEKKLELNGVGYRVEPQGKNLKLALGFSHPVIFPAPEGITFHVENNVITIAGVDRQLVGETAAQLRALKKVEPYKGKGMKYVGEQVRRKVGKVVKGSE